jgi:protein-S-isoprenylcysteine O-methyltransferase Ste14
MFPAVWIAYLGYWYAMSSRVKAVERQETAGPRLMRLGLMLSAMALLILPKIPLAVLAGRFLPDRIWCFWVGLVITSAGLLFSVQARRHLGENWSQSVTLKEDHELITSGPYALVRHPIYTGLLAGFLGSAIARGEWRGLIACGLVFLALWRKLRLEEKWLREQFGKPYEAYCQRVAALVPHIL